MEFLSHLFHMTKDEQKEVVNRATNELGIHLDTDHVISLLSMVAAHCVDV